MLGQKHLASGRLLRMGGGRASMMRSTTSAFCELDNVLYGTRLRPYLDKAGLADKSGVCTTELLVVRAKAQVNSKLLRYEVFTLLPFVNMPRRGEN